MKVDMRTVGMEAGNVATRAANRFAKVGTRALVEALAAAWLCVALVAAAALGAEPEPEPVPEPKPKYHPSPEAATQALIAAVKGGEEEALVAVLGPGSNRLVDSGDAVADRSRFRRFAARFDEANRIVTDGDAKAVLEVGTNHWPFPVPLVKEEAGWRFDCAAGEDEILNRRIGENELSAVQVCLAIVDAQREYYLRNPEQASLLHYAERFASEEGKRDGLYWKTAPGEEPSPLGPLVAEARAEGYAHGEADGERRPYHGYYFKMLTRQGSEAPGGAYDYVAQGKMIGGFAVVAFPAEYGSSGVMTFLVNHDGVVYQKDLGPETEQIADGMKEFNPDATWSRAEDAAHLGRGTTAHNG